MRTERSGACFGTRIGGVLCFATEQRTGSGERDVPVCLSAEKDQYVLFVLFVKMMQNESHCLSLVAQKDDAKETSSCCPYPTKHQLSYRR